jgi:hypothetical protein
MRRKKCVYRGSKTAPIAVLVSKPMEFFNKKILHGRHSGTDIAPKLPVDIPSLVKNSAAGDLKPACVDNQQDPPLLQRAREDSRRM